MKQEEKQNYLSVLGSMIYSTYSHIGDLQRKLQRGGLSEVDAIKHPRMRQLRLLYVRLDSSRRAAERIETED